MLKTITVNNFAIIDNLELDFNKGMTVLTGETGAGKSIIIDALQYTLGARADVGMVRHGCTRADLSVLFDVDSIPAALTWLQANELDDGQQCLLRRTINADGRSKQFINGQPCTQNQLRELAPLLINIHGQHENQSLGKKTTQQQLLDDFAASLTITSKRNQTKALDKFADHGALLQEVQQHYQQWAAINQQLAALSDNGSDHSARIDLLSYQLQELEQVGVTTEELPQLAQEHKKLSVSDAILDDCTLADRLLADGNDETIRSLLNTCISKLHKHQQYDARIANSCKMLNDALIQIEESHHELSSYLEHVEINPERLQQIEARISLIHDLARKHRIKPEELPGKQEQIKQELDNLQHAGERSAKLLAEREQVEQRYQAAGAKLSASRAKAAKQFNQLVSDNIRQLGMPGGQFAVEFGARDTISQYGLEQTEFLVSANPGQPLKPITKVASGGELSRISLAIEVITAENTNTPTLIFDEVDVGIGGGTAEIVGKLLRALGHKTQVLCITHLPQVAAQAHHHLQVIKTTDGKQTQTQLQALSGEEKVYEIARMLGGVKLTEQTLAHARSLLEEV
ncbi:MAG: DNA repair protein RecN [Gammaproteobacteria bacterium]|nr:DNA repair protein RecN [Gammaproteobacteria bacterium]